jgi:23S rRNA (guanosine2251-2'-O)-methyltransferase
MKLNAKQLRVTPPTAEEFAQIKRNPIYIVLDNVLDTYNIGSIFRLADAVAAQEIILCGGSETPPSSRIHKAAVGTEEWVTWSYSKSAGEAIKRLRAEIASLKVVAVEQDERAKPLSELFIDGPVAIVVGHETDGVSKEALELVDTIVELPMFGVNKSLNVVVSTGIILYKILENVKLL